jgi:hypothetical protein
MFKPASALIVLLSLTLLLGLSACDAAPGPDQLEETPSPPTPAPATAPAESPDFSYLTGTWTVTTTLTDIDNAMMTGAANQPGATWSCEVTGDTMTLLTDRHEYEGTLTPEADNGWVYEASATFTDEDGYTWTSTIEVHGKPTSTGLDSFVGTMTGSIDSDDEGHLYTAEWGIEGVRQQ